MRMKKKRIKDKKDKKKLRDLNIEKKIKDGYFQSKKAIEKSLKHEILYVIGIAFGIASLVFFMVSRFIYSTDIGSNSYITYTESRERIQDELLDLVSQLNELGKLEFNSTLDFDNMRYTLESSSRESGQAYLYDRLYNDLQYMSGEYLDIELGNISELYSQLRALIVNNEWSQAKAAECIESYYKKLGITKGSLQTKKINGVINNSMYSGWYAESQTYLVDGAGKIVGDEGLVDSLNLTKMIQKANTSERYSGSNSFTAVYPVVIDGEVYYLFNDTILEPTEHVYHYSMGNILGFIAGTGVFILIIFRLVKDKIDYIEYLSKCLGEISKGDLSYEIEVIGTDELARVAESITYMESQLDEQIKAQIQAEKIKNELVTNVAHDLRTPLTSIIGYIGLVKNKAYQDQEEADKYLDIAYNKAEKLKIIIEDLFELTKLHQDAVRLNKKSISVSHLIAQLTEEMMPLADDKNITVESYIDYNDAYIEADVPKITRVFENLIENAIKYSQEGDTVYIEVKSLRRNVYVAVSNPIREEMTQEEVNRLFDRFYRADQSRNSETGGSGLGLAISKNIVELHGGKISAKINRNLISFKVGIPKQVV